MSNIKPLKILHIIPSLSKGGAERLVLDICTELSQRVGIRVKLVTFSEKIDFLFLSKNIDWEVIPADVKLSLFKKNKKNINELQKCIEKFKPDIIHTHLFEAEIISRSCFYPNAKWFSHCHDNMVQFRNLSLSTFLKKTKITNYYEKIYLFNRYKVNGGTNFIAISNDTKQYFELSANPYPCIFLPNAINYDVFYNPNVKKEISKKIKLINVGSFVDKKNQSFLIDVVNVLKKRNIDVELNLLGDGKNIVLIKQKIQELNLEDQVILHGNVNTVEKLLWQSDIYVHSAIYEPSGLVLIEAMAAGLPIITLDGKGNRDLIKNDKNGYLFFEQNANKFAKAIVDLYNDKNKYQSMSAFAQFFAKDYDIKDYCKKLLELYTKQINE